MEFNLVAASLGALGEGVFDYHQTVLRKNCVDTGEHNHRVDIVKGDALLSVKVVFSWDMWFHKCF